MIQGFEEQTRELNQVERDLIPAIIRGLKNHISKDNAITNAKMCAGIRNWNGMRISEARMRKIIHYIQMNGLLIGLVSAGNNGYYVTNDVEEVKRYVDSLVARSNSIMNVAIAVRNQFNI